MAISVALRALVAAAALALSTCTLEPVTPLRVGVLIWPAYEVGPLARELGYLDPERIQLIDYRVPAVAVRDYRNGVLDVLTLSANYVLRIAQSDPSQRIILALDESIGGDVILAREGIDSIADIAGRPIGVEGNTLGAYVLARALSIHGMNPEQLNIVPADLLEQESLYRAGRIDVATVYEPFAGRIRALGAHAIFDSAELRGEIIDVLVTTATTVEAREKDLRHLVEGWLRAVDFVSRETEEAAAIMGRRHKLSAEELLTQLHNSVDLYDLEDNRRLLSGSPAPLASNLLKVHDISLEHGLLRGRVELGELLTDRLLPGTPSGE